MAEGRAGALEDYATAAFSVSGVKQDISLEDWKGGWASIVGGLNGKPTSQQFNMVTYILSALLNQAISDLSTVKGTANSALPKSDFTAKQIVALLAAYGLMEGCDADTVDGKHANAFAPSTHEHSASQITSGNLPIERGGTGSGTSADAWAHKARVLASAYYHNRRYIEIGDCLPIKAELPKDDALEILPAADYEEFLKIERAALLKFADENGIG